MDRPLKSRTSGHSLQQLRWPAEKRGLCSSCEKECILGLLPHSLFSHISSHGLGDGSETLLGSFFPLASKKALSERSKHNTSCVQKFFIQQSQLRHSSQNPEKKKRRGARGEGPKIDTTKSNALGLYFRKIPPSL